MRVDRRPVEKLTDQQGDSGTRGRFFHGQTDELELHVLQHYSTQHRCWKVGTWSRRDGRAPSPVICVTTVPLYHSTALSLYQGGSARFEELAIRSTTGISNQKSRRGEFLGLEASIGSARSN
jgi:hypothetical protein